ncbi:GntR family transcriptional regulator [Lapidilactobacillus achengensis]|uniref:GntR family transcriptional regulator n=1 Tax=Lapidilactobacillus achengensis TaxID=2486000 RepID=A0ABW1UN20_9LACO|nr:LacI family DNA-binding transcriptional regulator [Lapidilactobacillus achengensis]
MQLPMYINIYNDLKKQINNQTYKIGDFLPTEKEISDTYGVSRITSQKAMRLLSDDGIIERTPGIGSVVKKAVLAQESPKIIGLILSGITDSYGTILLESLVHECEHLEYQLIVRFSGESQSKETHLINELSMIGCSGLLIEPVQQPFYSATLIEKIYNKFPIIVLDRELKGFDSYFVGSNHYTGAMKSADFLIDHGHFNVLILGYEHLKNTTLETRIEAFSEAYWRTNSPISSDNISRIVRSTYKDDFTRIAIDVDRVKRAITTNRPTCVIALDAHIAGIAQEAIKQLCLLIPENISLFAFDSSESSFISTNASHLAQNEPRIATESVELLNEILNRHEPKLRKRLIETEIVDSGSVRKIK